MTTTLRNGVYIRLHISYMNYLCSVNPSIQDFDILIHCFFYYSQSFLNYAIKQNADTITASVHDECEWTIIEMMKMIEFSDISW